ncbi:MAG: glycosyltransferase family 4 protein [Bryobacterales bacterium]|nr:glycosyltransferase family 4 protein [Bryobacterales bacterium]
MRILFDARRLQDFGIGTYIRNLVAALAAFDSVNEYRIILQPDDARELKLPPNFEQIVYPHSDLEVMDNFRFPSWIRHFGADLYHIPLNRVPLFMPKPFVVTTHDLSTLLYDEVESWRHTLRRLRIRRSLMRAERVIVVSGATLRDLENFMAVPHDRIRLVYNAPNPEFFAHRHVADSRAAGPEAAQRDRERILERYQVNYPFLLYAGSIRPQKNVPRLVEAFALVREQLENHPVYRDLRLIIIGDEISRYPSVRRAVIQSRVEPVVRFLGFVPFGTLRVFYEAATAFVFPSLYEGFGLPPLEAMASGTPVITSSTSSLPEVVGDAAVLVNPENVFDIARGIKEVLLDDALRERLKAAGPVQSAKFSWERTAREVLSVYEEVLRK